MPGNGLAFAVKVGRQIERVGLLDRLDDGVDVLLVLFDQVVVHREIVIGIDGAFLRHQITHVTVRREDLEILAEVFVDRLGLGGRFDDKQVLGHGAVLGAGVGWRRAGGQSAIDFRGKVACRLFRRTHEFADCQARARRTIPK